MTFHGLDAYLRTTADDDEALRKGVREMAAKSLGIREAELAI